VKKRSGVNNSKSHKAPKTKKIVSSKKATSTTKKKSSTTHHKQNNKPEKSLYQKFLKIEHDLPLGMRVMTVYLFILAFFYGLTGLYLKKAMVFGLFISGFPSFLVNAAIIGLIFYMIYGIAKKDIKHYYLINIFFGLVIFNTLLSIFSIRSLFVGAIRSYINFSFVLVLILNIITLLFLMSKKYYFLHPKPEYHVHATDKLFMISLVFIWLCLIIGTMFYANLFFRESYVQANQLIFELKDKGLIESSLYCQKSQNPDLCFYIAAQLNKEDPNSKTLCKGIRFPFYYFDCMKRVEAAQ